MILVEFLLTIIAILCRLSDPQDPITKDAPETR